MSRKNLRDEARMQEKSVVRALREQAGITQAELAVAVGVAVTTVSRWEQPPEKGTVPALTPAEWMRFCRVLGIQWKDIPRYFLHQNARF